MNWKGLVEAMTTYHAQVSRDDTYWLVHVPEIDRTTQARHLGEVDVMARDLISVMTGQEANTISLEVDVELPGGGNLPPGTQIN